MVSKLKFVSIFPTLQGEGINTGQATTFIRLYTDNCFPNKSFCSFCDTINKKNYNENLSVNDIEEHLMKTKPYMITITGGEPFSLDFESLRYLIVLCKKYCVKLEVETNGAYLSSFTNIQKEFFINNFNNINISPKLKTSNVNWEYKNTYNFLKFKPVCNFKFVISEKNFDEEIKEVNRWNNELLLNEKIWLMPMTPSNLKFEQKLFDKCIELKYNYSCRLHITLFGNIEEEI